jgi:hypothetical protein
MHLEGGHHIPVLKNTDLLLTVYLEIKTRQTFCHRLEMSLAKLWHTGLGYDSNVSSESVSRIQDLQKILTEREAAANQAVTGFEHRVGAEA